MPYQEAVGLRGLLLWARSWILWSNPESDSDSGTIRRSAQRARSHRLLLYPAGWEFATFVILRRDMASGSSNVRSTVRMLETVFLCRSLVGRSLTRSNNGYFIAPSCHAWRESQVGANAFVCADCFRRIGMSTRSDFPAAELSSVVIH